MKSTWNVLIGVCVGAVVGFVIGQHLGGSGWKGPSTPQAEQRPRRDPSQLPPGSDQIYRVLLGDAPVRGKPQAKITIVEWSDFQCPFCGRAIETLERIEKTYGDEVRIAFKHNPLPIHPDAPYAARAAVAAMQQGKFWEMHDKLFEANNTRKPDALKRDKVDRMAADLGLDMEKFKAAVNDRTTGDVISSDQAQARQLGANGTPHFFINGARLSGAMPFETFKALIDRELKRANEALAKGVPREGLYDALTKDGLIKVADPVVPAPQVVAKNVDPGNGPSVGPKNAKVTIVEWSDFQCPFCGQVEPTLRQILDTYKNDVRLVWRNEPLDFHQNALPAAKAAMAAHRQGKFWPMHEKLFAHQKELSEENYEVWAHELGLNVARWKADKDSPAVAEQIKQDTAYGLKVGADGTPAFFINGRFVSGAMPFDIFKNVIDEQIRKADELKKKGVKPEKLYQALVEENVKEAGGSGDGAKGADARTPIDIGNAPVRGPKDAKVTIAMWSDFQCPFCSRVEPTLKQLEADYKGKIRFAWKNQPLSFHSNAMPAAEAAMAAYEQGNDKFWAMHDKLFENQGVLSPELYEKLAQEIGLDMPKWKAAVASHKFAGAIQADIQAGNAAGANGTPTFFINGKKLEGAQPLEAFKQAIDAELASKVAKK